MGMHAPQEVPAQYSNLFPSPQYSPDYAIQNGMGNIADEVLGNVTSLLQAKGMWDNTLLIYTSDNGGPSGEAASGHSANNYPLRGGKTNFFQGGVRVSAFVAGGFLPTAVRGQHRTGYLHSCDWYPTVLGLAGGDPTDDHPLVPSVDGLNMWPYLTGAAGESPRTEIMIGTERITQKDGEKGGWNGALISGDLKIILGIQSYGFWTGPVYPNATTNHSAEHSFNCNEGCLFNITQDPSEYTDLASTKPIELAAMQALFRERNKTMFETPKRGTDMTTCQAFVAKHHGFVGPYQPPTI